MLHFFHKLQYTFCKNKYGGSQNIFIGFAWKYKKGACLWCTGFLNKGVSNLTKWRNRKQRWALVPVLSLHVIRTRAVGAVHTWPRHSTSSECILTHGSGDNYYLYSWLFHRVSQTKLVQQSFGWNNLHPFPTYIRPYLVYRRFTFKAYYVRTLILIMFILFCDTMYSTLSFMYYE